MWGVEAVGSEGVREEEANVDKRCRLCDGILSQEYEQKGGKHYGAVACRKALRAERDRLAQENAALRGVLRAADKCVGVINRRTNSWDYAEVEYAHVEAVREAIDKARALVGSSEE